MICFQSRLQNSALTNILQTSSQISSHQWNIKAISWPCQFQIIMSMTVFLFFYYQPSGYSGWKDNRWVGRSAACFAMYSPLCLFVAHILRSYGHIFYWKAHLDQVHKGCRHINTLLDYILTSAERPRWIFINADARTPSPFITSVHLPSKPSSLNFFMNIKGCIMSAHRLTALELILLLS